jgi:hypothetical protein
MFVYDTAYYIYFIFVTFFESVECNILAAARDFLFLQSIQTGCWVNPGVLSVGLKLPGVKLTAHLYVVLKLRISGAKPPLFHMS